MVIKISSGSGVSAGTVTGLSGYPLHVKKVAGVGREFHRRHRNMSRGRTMSQDSMDEDIKGKIKKMEASILKKYRKSIRGRDFLKLTMYQQLGIADVGFDATNDQIKKAYHRVLIEHHPDKTGKTENDPNYLAVQKAFTTLTDPAKRRAYDSMCDFDDSIPSGNEKIKQNDMEDAGGSGKGEGVCFYELYGPVFDRNARFSQNKPVPSLGTDEDSLDKVYAFYDFYLKFDSWRDFSHDTEHDVDSAQHRDEKRYLQKKIEAESKKKKKQEYARLANLTDRAMAADPRIKREKYRAKAAKAKAKQDKEDAIAAAKKAEEDRAEAEAAAAKAEEDARKEKAKSAKFEKEKMKKALRKAKKAFRALMEKANEDGCDGAVDALKTELLCDSLELAEIVELTDAMGKTVEGFNAKGLDAVNKRLSAL